MRSRFLIAYVLVVLELAMSAVGGTSGQEASPANSQVFATAVPSIESRLGEARTTLALAEGLGDAAITNTPAGISLQDIATRRALLSRLVRLLEQQLSNVAELETTKNRVAEVTRKAQAWTRFAESPPYSILLTDRLREEIQTEQLKNISGEATVGTIEQLLSDNRNELTQTEQRIRQINEKLEGAMNPAAAARLSWQRELERLRSQVAAASISVLDSERQLREETVAESRIRVNWLKRQVVLADAGARFTQSDLDQVLARIESARLLIERELTEAQTRLTNLLQEVEVSGETLRRTQDSQPDAKARASETLAARHAQLEAVQGSIRTLRFILESENVERAMWEMRFAVDDSHSVETLNESEHRLATFTRRLNLWRDYGQQQMEFSPSQIELEETRIRTLSPDSDLMPLARERLTALRERDELLQRLMRRINHVQRLGERWSESVRVAEQQLPFFGRLQNMFSDASSFVRRLWAFELLTAEDTITVEGQSITGKRSVTVGKILLAVLILGLGIWITGVISRVAEPIIIRRLKIEANQANLIRRWLRAFLVVCLVMFSLVSVKIPLTIFAFAGGALAIGLGFGTQTILKNFVSGLILLFERPFRVGDVLEVGGSRGAVTEIGLRASVLQLWDGTETLIPNSTLLENNVSNWTYSSRKVRFTVTVSAAYGSDTRRVIQLLGEAAERHGLVEKEPKPQAFLADFGESALNFELRFWVDVINANAAQIASDLRQMISGTFVENGIVIAFPQRDLHLDTARPFAIEIVSAQNRKQAESASPVGGEDGSNGGGASTAENKFTTRS